MAVVEKDGEEGRLALQLGLRLLSSRNRALKAHESDKNSKVLKHILSRVNILCRSHTKEIINNCVVIKQISGRRTFVPI